MTTPEPDDSRQARRARILIWLEATIIGALSIISFIHYIVDWLRH